MPWSIWPARMLATRSYSLSKLVVSLAEVIQDKTDNLDLKLYRIKLNISASVLNSQLI
jgi:hypothetical protein